MIQNIENIYEEVVKLSKLLKENNSLYNLGKSNNLPFPTYQLLDRFTVAVVGLWRIGKSTLLNALIEDDIAPTAVNECTATVNRFLHSDDPAMRDLFHVHWRDSGKVEELERIQIGAWLGDSEKAKKTLRLDFFAKAKFLQSAYLVDTPGFGSTLDDHEKNALGVCSQKAIEDLANLEANSRKQGAAADAVIYVIRPVMKKNDDELLSLFGEASRLPGSNPYNSIAVIHKWEPYWEDLDTDPSEFLAKKIARLEQQLQGKVACVVAASGLLERSLFWLETEHWQFFTRCGNGAFSKQQIERLSDLNEFHDPNSSLAVSFDERQALLTSIQRRLLATGMIIDTAQNTAEHLIRFLCRFAYVRKTADAQDFKRQVKALAGIADLKTILRKRFYSRAQLLKMGTLISRFIEPDQMAVERLLRLEQQRKDQLNEGDRILALLETKRAFDTEIAPVVAYVRNTFVAIENDAQHIKNLRKKLVQLNQRLERFFRTFEEDMAYLEMLDQSEHLPLSSQERAELRALFGVNGMAVSDRVGNADMAEIRMRFNYWGQKTHESFGVIHKIAKATTRRLNAILDHMEAQMSKIS